MTLPEAGKNKDLSTSLHHLWPTLLLSLITAGATDLQPWLGCTGVLLLISVVTSMRKTIMAPKVTVKGIEVALLSLLLPLFASISFTWYGPKWPVTNFSCTLALLSTAIQHLALLWRMRLRVKHLALLLWSAFLLASTIIVALSVRYMDLSRGLPALIVIFYSAASMGGSIYMMRKKISLAVFVWISFFASFALLTCCIVASLLDGRFYTTPFIAACLFAIVHTGLDFAYQKRKLGAESSLPLYQLVIKFFGAAAILAWYLAGEAVHANLSRKDDSQAFLFIFFALFFVHCVLQALIWDMRRQEPMLLKETSVTKKTVGIIVAIVVDVLAMVWLGFVYGSGPPNVHRPAEYLMMTFASGLFLLMIYLLDNIRSYLARFYGKLLAGSAGIVAYFILYSIFSDNTAIAPVKRVFAVSAFIFVNLAVYFGLALYSQKQKKNNVASADVESTAIFVTSASASTEEKEESEADVSIQPKELV